ncbi:MAG: ribosome silencing factor [Salaquimonas sp.]
MGNDLLFTLKGRDQPKRIKLVNTLHAGGANTGSKPQTSNAVDFSAEDVLKNVMESLDDSKAEDIKKIDIRGKSALGDYMVIASGRSHRHVAAISDQIIRELKAGGFGNAKVEGQQAADWVLIDTGDIIIHIFRPEVRDFYGIEKMWSIPDQAERH